MGLVGSIILLGLALCITCALDPPNKWGQNWRQWPKPRIKIWRLLGPIWLASVAYAVLFCC